MAGTREVLSELGITPSRLYQLIFDGILPRPARRIGSSYAWTADEISHAKRILAERGRRRPSRQAAAA